MEGNHPPQRTSFDLGAVKDEYDIHEEELTNLKNVLSPIKAISPYQGLQAQDSIVEHGASRLNSIDEGEHALNN